MSITKSTEVQFSQSSPGGLFPIKYPDFLSFKIQNFKVYLKKDTFKIQACDNFIKRSETFHLIGCYNYTPTCDFRETVTIRSHPVKQKEHLGFVDRSSICAKSGRTVKCWNDLCSTSATQKIILQYNVENNMVLNRRMESEPFLRCLVFLIFIKILMTTSCLWKAVSDEREPAGTRQRTHAVGKVWIKYCGFQSAEGLRPRAAQTLVHA